MVNPSFELYSESMLQREENGGQRRKEEKRREVERGGGELIGKEGGRGERERRKK